MAAAKKGGPQHLKRGSAAPRCRILPWRPGRKSRGGDHSLRSRRRRHGAAGSRPILRRSRAHRSSSGNVVVVFGAPPRHLRLQSNFIARLALDALDYVLLSGTCPQ